MYIQLKNITEKKLKLVKPNFICLVEMYDMYDIPNDITNKGEKYWLSKDPI